MSIAKWATAGVIVGSLAGVSYGVANASDGPSAQRVRDAELLEAYASRDGYAGSTQPAMAYLAACLIGKGFEAEYNDTTGYLIFGTGQDEEGRAMLTCLEDLADKWRDA